MRSNVGEISGGGFECINTFVFFYCAALLRDANYDRPGLNDERGV